MLAAACDDGHVVGDPITAGSQTGPQAGATTAGGVYTIAEGTAAGGAPLLGTGGNVPTAGGAVASGGATLLAAGGAFTGGATSLSAGGAFRTGGATSLSAGGALLTGGSTSVGNSAPVCVLYVATSGDDSNDGRRWSSAFANVQTAIDTGTHLVDNDDCSEIEVWVAQGTYKPTYLDDSTDARTATFQLAANVALYGGFAGTESKQSDRNIESHVTILSGDIGNQDDTKDNSYHVVTGETGATLDGFTVTGGNSNAVYPYNPDRDAATEKHDKATGGGMYNDGASPTVANCTFVNNDAINGGGMYNDGASPTVANCTFVNNDATDGGGIFNANSSPTITNCVFTKNYPGAMYNSYSSPTVQDCTFWKNSGGGINNFYSSPIVTNCTFNNNSGNLWAHGGYGGATYGGGMYNVSSSPTVTSCLFIDNSVSMGGAFVGFGGGMYNSGSSTLLINCTFANNSGQSGGAIYNNNWGVSADSVKAINCIFWGDTNETGVGEIEPRDSMAVTYSIVQGGYDTGTAIITDDPLFVDAANDDFRLSDGSPAIDSGGCASGVTATDIVGAPRWNIANVADGPGNGVDIGAYEYQGAEGTDSVVTDLGCQ
jgi:hypothetical protein